MFKSASLLLFMLSFVFFSCKKESEMFSDSGKLTFSKDTVIFDTVFASVGSSTYQLKVYNNESHAIKISNIRLAKGSTSPYRINIDGFAANAKDLEIESKDSIFIFVEVTIDPGNTNNPFIVQDSILFERNGSIQDVDLVAWGQNAHYITPTTYLKGFPPFSVLGCDTNWSKNIPHVVYGFAVVDSTCKLSIEAGTKIYFHNNSGLWVYKGGSIKVNGTKEEPVIFQGDRLEPYYKDLANQWSRIWINEGSVDNEFNYAIIKNAYIGIQAETFDNSMGNQLIINNTIIENMAGMGILARRYKITAANNLITNCGQYAVALTLGGEYDFTHCTVANYWSSSTRKNPSVFISNYYKDPAENLFIAPLVKANFNNCIVYGNAENEIMTDKLNDAEFNYSFNYSLLKTNKSLLGQSIFTNIDPGFVEIEKKNFMLKNTSFAIDKGNPAYLSGMLLNDLNGKSRAGNPDLGAYELE